MYISYYILLVRFLGGGGAEAQEAQMLQDTLEREGGEAGVGK
jgi:hypothetical protein